MQNAGSKMRGIPGRRSPGNYLVRRKGRDGSPHTHSGPPAPLERSAVPAGFPLRRRKQWLADMGASAMRAFPRLFHLFPLGKKVSALEAFRRIDDQRFGPEQVLQMVVQFFLRFADCPGKIADTEFVPFNKAENLRSDGHPPFFRYLFPHLPVPSPYFRELSSWEIGRQGCFSGATEPPARAVVRPMPI